MRHASSPAALRGVGLVALASATWGTTGSVTTIVVDRADATPLVIGAVRMAIAAVVLGATAWAVAGRPRLGRRDALRALGCGVCMAAFQAAYFTAVTLTGITVAALLAICSAPVMIAALAAVFLGERPTWRLGGALALGLAGTFFLVAGPPPAARAASAFVVGAGLAVLAGLAYAGMVVLAKVALARAAPLTLAAATFIAAAVVMAPALATDGASGQIAAAWPWLLYLGVVATAGAYGVYTIGLRDIPASVAGVVTLVEPLTATLLGVLVFDERLAPQAFAGALLLLLSFLTIVTTPP